MQVFYRLAEKAKAILNGGKPPRIASQNRPAGRNATVEILYVAYDSGRMQGR